MAKLPFPSARNAIRALKRAGFAEDRRKGSHLILNRRFEPWRLFIPDGRLRNLRCEPSFGMPTSRSTSFLSRFDLGRRLRVHDSAIVSKIHFIFIRIDCLIEYVRMSKLTLSVEKGVVSRAKRYAKQQGVSVSEMVEEYLAAVVAPPSPGLKDPPILRSLRGSLKRGDVEDYRRHLAAKYK